MPVDRTTGADTGILLDIDLADRLLEIYLDIERRLAADIARRLAAGMEAPTWAQDKLREVAQLRRAAENLLRAAARDTDGAVAQALVLAYMRGGEAANRELAKYSLAPLTTPVKDALQEVLDARRIEAMSVLARVTRAFPGLGALQRMVWSLAARLKGTYLPVLRWTEDVYRKVIAETALPSVLLGVSTRRRAAQVAWERLLSDGVTGFVDKAGRNWELASYVEMAVRAGTAQAAVEGHLDRLDEAKIDLIVVSNAPLECEKCEPWEGKVLARKGTIGPRTVQVESAISDDLVTVSVAGTVVEAVAAGLLHPNCRHSLSAFLPGVTRIPTNTADPEGRKARERLRALERKVRKEKRLAAAAIDPAAGRAHTAKARDWQALIRDHVAATQHLGIRRKPERERIGTAR